MRAIRRFTVRPVLPGPLYALRELAGNLRWSWHPPTQELFASIDADAWERSGRDPITLLGLVPAARLDELATDAEFLERLRGVRGDLESYLTDDRWYQTLGPDVPRCIGYFSPEYGITSVLPQYSGGLGILAGDHLKAASDLGVPILGVGLLYRHGYFRQSLSRDGWQQEHYPVLDPDELPLTLLRQHDGQAAKISVGMPEGGEAVARIWVASVGRVPLLLLDTDVEENAGILRDITDRLYGGNTEHRLRQEMLLGIGGVRAIRTYCDITGAVAPEVFHTNEGHAGFLGLERIRELTENHGLDFESALEVSRAGTVFTTHTPVPAGIDRFPRELVAQYFGGDNTSPGVPVDRILALGTESYDGGDPSVFNMAVMGLRLAQRANGVSELHGEVSSDMFGWLWPAFDRDERPITSITNGVHAPTWVAREVFALAREQGMRIDPGLSADRPEKVFEIADQIDVKTIWALKRTLRERLVLDARSRLRESWANRGAAPAQLGWVDKVLDPDVLTIGFARRVPSYKRLTLMLSDTERLKRLLLDADRPVQLVIAGKAHPADDGGKKLIQEIVHFADDPQVRHRIVFLPNYDIEMAESLYPGCDVWLNNPLRPYEACGTSGMKAALNGALNLSILDGWWDEWYDGNNGWAIPSADGVTDEHVRDDIEANALYDLIEHEVAPRFYDTVSQGGDALPIRWIEMVRHTLKSLGPRVLSTRMVRDYVQQLYAPAASSARAINSTFDGAHELAAFKARVRANWDQVRIDHVDTEGLSDSPVVGGTLDLKVFVSLGSLSPGDVEVQVLHGRVKGEDDLVTTAVADLNLAESYEAGRHRFEGKLVLDRPGPFGYTVRVLPHHAALASPAELGLVALA